MTFKEEMGDVLVINNGDYFIHERTGKRFVWFANNYGSRIVPEKAAERIITEEVRIRVLESERLQNG